jgi:YNFM family putative membrane transporter
VTASALDATALPAPIRAGEPAFFTIRLALFAGGFSTFWLLYWVQPLLPMLAHDLALSPASSSTVLSFSTAALALALLPASLLADRYGRRALMCGGLLAAAVLTVAAALAPNWHGLLALRLLCGLVLAGMPAAAMAYLAEEFDPAALGSVMGLYIGGNALGGMAGRLASVWLADAWSWRVAALVVGLVGLAGALFFLRQLPASRRFVARPLPLSAAGRASLAARLREALGDPGLWALYATSFVAMGAFVSFYNYLGFYLEGAPFFLSHSLIGFIFLLYMLGSFSSAFSGRLSRRWGRGPVLRSSLALMAVALLLTLSSQLGLVVLGVSILTCAFFAAHAVASSWVGARARSAKAMASALYLSSYYLGSSVLGSSAGLLWGWGQWPSVAWVLIGAVLLGLLALRRLSEPTHAAQA